ncbi:uncharacterized WD repeat-containing protein all2124-like isoform X1 [Patiria miniata]|uniref:Anaphase-promoting complex subunit 4-like WD40 domain-containing protein n=1 Tax=Patiria miniata TaxID=46514 RepID=A0A914AR94_PATMI|nr:uncharacterized WD repeat-containing protein all2124-like isoform X1 [Patiria miniata]XP_038065911.1 uncharacterized WD repeat-containing protein all2124-like isoform X1 [Patiria miniata]
MARRRLEAAIRAGRAIDSEQSKPQATFTKLMSLRVIDITDYFSGVYSLQFSHDGDLLAIGCGNGGVLLYSTNTGEMVKSLHKGGRMELPVMGLSFHPEHKNELVSVGADGNINVWDIEETKKKMFNKEKNNEINAIDFSLDGDVYATAGKDLCIRLYDAQTNQLLQTYEGSNQLLPVSEDENDLGHGRRVFALKFHPDDNSIFVTGGWDNCLKIWDKRTSHGVQGTIGGPHVCGSGIDIKSGKILTASWVASSALQVWDLAMGRLEQSVPLSGTDKKGEFLYCAQFCDNNVVLAGGSGTCNAQAIDRTTNQLIGHVDLDGKAVQALDSTDGGRYIAVAGSSPVVKLAQLA